MCAEAEPTKRAAVARTSSFDIMSRAGQIAERRIPMNVGRYRSIYLLCSFGNPTVSLHFLPEYRPPDAPEHTLPMNSERLRSLTRVSPHSEPRDVSLKAYMTHMTSHGDSTFVCMNFG